MRRHQPRLRCHYTRIYTPSGIYSDVESSLRCIEVKQLFQGLRQKTAKMSKDSANGINKNKEEGIYAPPQELLSTLQGRKQASTGAISHHHYTATIQIRKTTKDMQQTGMHEPPTMDEEVEEEAPNPKSSEKFMPQVRSWAQRSVV